MNLPNTNYFFSFFEKHFSKELFFKSDLKNNISTCHQTLIYKQKWSFDTFLI